MAGLGKYCMGGYGRIGVYRVLKSTLQTLFSTAFDFQHFEYFHIGTELGILGGILNLGIHVLLIR